MAEYPYFESNCAAVQNYFNTVSVVITRDKYDIPKENYLVNEGIYCDVRIGQVDESAIYASLGQPFLKTFYTSLNYDQNCVFFGVSTTVTVRGEIRLFPNILQLYLGFVILVIPPIIVAFCMEYNYCPKRRFR